MTDTKQQDPVFAGIDPETYQELYQIAKKQNKSVSDVMSDALRETIEKHKQVNESKKERQILCEG